MRVLRIASWLVALSFATTVGSAPAQSAGAGVGSGVGSAVVGGSVGGSTTSSGGNVDGKLGGTVGAPTIGTGSASGAANAGPDGVKGEASSEGAAKSELPKARKALDKDTGLNPGASASGNVDGAVTR